MEILWSDSCCLVANKPARLPTQAPRGIDSLETQVRDYLAGLVGAEPTLKPPYLGIPHRLDRAVSGAIIFATTRKAARGLSLQFEKRYIVKIYCALVEGRVEPTVGTWQDHMCKIPDQPRAQLVAAKHADASQAILHYRVLWQNDEASLLSVQLETGRMHQIRLQAASRGHAVWGDSDYGATRSFGPATDEPRERIIALHAREIGFRSPSTQLDERVVAPFPEHWRQQTGLPSTWLDTDGLQPTPIALDP